MVAIMRLVEIESGKIYVDGADLSHLGLHQLRSRIAVIPQDPVLFSGTVRTNLDPFDEYSDITLIQILERVGLMDKRNLKSPITSLNDKVSEGGSNLSFGQRQLLVIGRALLTEASLIICDEATAAVDAETDARIHKIFRSDFAKATCLTVAHRLNTIMDSDFILVMQDGKAVEFDSPENLLQRKQGNFKDLITTWEDERM
jgi:ABC-type multidrug transport system fused ATPase/permease subunit